MLMSVPDAASVTGAGAPPPRRSERRQLLGRGAVVGTGLVVEMGVQFVRTVILAHLLGATEFGLLASINMLYLLVDMSLGIGLDRYVVYAADGGKGGVLGVVHTLAALRGVLSAILVVALAVPTAIVIGAPQYAGSFALVAAVPLLGGFAHCGLIQMQRVGRFWPTTFATALGAVVGGVAAVVAALIAPDHRAILWGLGVQMAVVVIATHVLARPTPYRLSLDLAHMRAALRFGLPLTLNGLALAIASQLDRLVVGAWLGVVALGVYGLAATLVFQPISLLARLATTILQPRLSAAWHADPTGRFSALMNEVLAASLALGAAGAVLAGCLGAPTLRLLFGPSFAVGDAFFVVLAGVVFLRLGRAAQNLLGLAVGRTTDLMVSNLAAATGLVATVCALSVRPALESAALGMLVGEIVSFVVVDLRMRAHMRASGRPALKALAFAAVLPACMAAWTLLADPGLWSRSVAALAGALVVAAAGLMQAIRLSSHD